MAEAEVFGPVASLMSFTDVEDALERANSTRFGLSAQIWGQKANEIQYLAENLVAGSVWVNTYRAFHPTVPYGGTKESGYGRENGFDAVRAYTRSKAVTWDLTADRSLPYS